MSTATPVAKGDRICTTPNSTSTFPRPARLNLTLFLLLLNQLSHLVSSSFDLYARTLDQPRSARGHLLLGALELYQPQITLLINSRICRLQYIYLCT